MITVEQAHELGAKRGPVSEHERQLFEAWMRGHCWAIQGDWDGSTYVHEAERTFRQVHLGAMNTRQLWAAWRDRAALTPVAPTTERISEPVCTLMFERTHTHPRAASFTSKNWFEAGIIAAEAFHRRSLFANGKQDKCS